MATLWGNTVFTNTALTPEGDIWWEGMTPEPPPQLIDWHGEPWTPASGRSGGAPERALHRARRASARRSRPSGRTRAGVPISAILFGGRRAATVPLVYEARSWEHGVFVGATMASETTAAAAGAVGAAAPRPVRDGAVLRVPHGRLLRALARDSAPAPSAPSCRASSRSTGSARTPNGRFLWPGFGENSRVLAWIAERCEGTAEAVESADRARSPLPGALPIEGLEISAGDLDALLAVDVAGWQAELPRMAEHLASFGDRLPPELLRAARRPARSAAARTDSPDAAQRSSSLARMPHRVTLIPGDGIGPELAEATRRVLDATGVEIDWDVQEAGVDVMARHGHAAARQRARVDPRAPSVALKAPITTPVGTASAASTSTCARRSTCTPASAPASSYAGVRTLLHERRSTS